MPVYESIAELVIIIPIIAGLKDGWVDWSLFETW